MHLLKNVLYNFLRLLMLLRFKRFLKRVFPSLNVFHNAVFANNIWSGVEIALEITLKAKEKGLNQKK